MKEWRDFRNGFSQAIRLLYGTMVKVDITRSCIVNSNLLSLTKQISNKIFLKCRQHFQRMARASKFLRCIFFSKKIISAFDYQQYFFRFEILQEVNETEGCQFFSSKKVLRDYDGTAESNSDGFTENKFEYLLGGHDNQ